MRTTTTTLRLALLAAIGCLPWGCAGQSISHRQGPSTGPNPNPCTSPTAGDDPSGNTETCDGALRHRAADGQCPSTLPRPTSLQGAAAGAACTRDTDCTAAPHGHCEFGVMGDPRCLYGCVTSAECVSGEVCDCGPDIGTCRPATCTTDADCPGDLLCTVYDRSSGCGELAFACQTPEDACGGDGECTGTTRYCSTALEGSTRSCQPTNCFIGRPFLVDGGERTSPVTSRADWSSALRPRTGGLDPALRARAADAWARAARMEHASVAAFARFVLELLALGAPAGLVERAVRAQSDEIGHAEDAFAIASAFAGRALGPGPLCVGDCLGEVTLASAVASAVVEGCIGETLAALEAAEARSRATDPAIVRALARVEREETEHAELAFRFVRWALEREPTLAGSVERLLTAELARDRATAAPASDTGTTPASASSARKLAELGVLGDGERARLRRRGLHEVLEPCLRALARSARERRAAPQRPSASARFTIRGVRKMTSSPR